MRGVFVTGTDTGVGKTTVSTLILREARAAGLRAGAFKPACSGAEDRDGTLVWDDVEQLQKAAGWTDSGGMPTVCSQVFQAPLAPPVAAAREGRMVDLHAAKRQLLEWNPHCDLLVVEGAGGLLCPLTETETIADFAVWTGLPLIVVARLGLGTINHTLLTVEAAVRRGLRVAAVILNDADNSEGTLAGQTNPVELRKRLDVSIPAWLPFGGTSLCLPGSHQPTRMDWLELAGPVVAERLQASS